MQQNPFVRFARWLGLDRNPLRRRSDRVEAMVRLAAVAAIAVAVVGGVLLALREYGAGLRTEAAEARARHSVDATLVEDVTPPKLTAMGSSAGHARAKWTAPDGTEWVGSVEAGPTARAGQVVRVWTDGSGALTPRPQDRETTVVAALTLGIGLPLIIAVLVSCGVLATRLTNQRRSRSLWEAQWTAVEPTWRING